WVSASRDCTHLEAQPRGLRDEDPGLGPAAEAPEEEQVREPVVLVADVQVAVAQVHRGIRSLVLAALLARACHGEVWLADEEVAVEHGRLDQRRAVLAYRMSRRPASWPGLARLVADIAHREFYRGVGPVSESELAIGHVQPAPHGIDGREVFVKEAAEAAVVTEPQALSARCRDDWPAAVQPGRRTCADHLAGVERHVGLPVEPRREVQA